MAVIDLATFGLVTVPLLLRFGLEGFAAACLVAQVVVLAGRAYFLGRLFPRFTLLRQAARAIVPVAPAVAAVGLARLAEGGERTGAMAASELAAYVVLVVAATALLERRLLREVSTYVRRGVGGRPDRPAGALGAAGKGALW